MNIFSQLQSNVIYEKIEINNPSLKKTSEEVMIAALLEGKVVGFMQLLMPEVSVFQQDGKGELELGLLFLEKECGKQSLIDFLLKEVVSFANSQNRVLVIEDGLFLKSNLLKRGFSEHSLREHNLLVYGQKYGYNLKNIEPKYFSQLDKAQLSSEDISYIENKLKEEKKKEVDETISKIIEEFQENLFNLIEQTNQKLKNLGGDFSDIMDGLENGGLIVSDTGETSGISLKTYEKIMNVLNEESYPMEEDDWEEEEDDTEEKDIEDEEVSAEAVQFLANLLNTISGKKPSNDHKRF